MKMNSLCPMMFLLNILSVLLSAAYAGIANISIEPTIIRLTTEKRQTIRLSVFLDELPSQSQVLRAVSGDPTVMSVEPFSTQLTEQQNSHLSANITVRGEFLGYTRLQFFAATNQTDFHQIVDFPVTVVRGRDVLNRVFVSTLIVLIIFANVLMGCQLNLEVVMEVLKKPIAPAIGMFCQFLIMPLIAFAIGSLMLANAGMPSMALGIFTAGCAPGGGASNYWTLLLHGNVDLSITMTFISTLAALGTMPFWMSLLGRHFLIGYEGVEITVPYRNIITSLLALVIPLLIGVTIKRYRERWATAALKLLRPLLLLILLFIMTMGVYANLYMFRLMRWRVLLSGLALPWCGFGAGCLLSVLARRPPGDVAAVAIETGIQNSGIAIMLLKVSFPQPEADLSAVIPVVVSLFTPAPLLFAVAIHKFATYLRERREHKVTKEQLLEIEAIDELSGDFCDTRVDVDFMECPRS